MNRTRTQKAFTLVETMVAISVLTLAIIAPMSLTTQSLSAAYYARDQITAFHLAQEALETVRSVRDKNIIKSARGTQAAECDTTGILCGIPIDTPFIVDTQDDSMASCTAGTCPPLQTDGDLYGYGCRPLSASSAAGCTAAGWENTRFTRTIRATFVRAQDEVNISVTVSWKTAGFQTRSFTIDDNLYRWVNDGSGISL